uniref:Uncharacterized protein n=1 Tax=Anguilla anguilla TaxID=7936 RepID=A0A0E9S110_ANGAN
MNTSATEPPNGWDDIGGAELVNMRSEHLGSGNSVVIHLNIEYVFRCRLISTLLRYGAVVCHSAWKSK